MLGGVDHRQTDAVLHAVSRVEVLEFGNDRGPTVAGEPAQAHQRCVPDELSDVSAIFMPRAFLEPCPNGWRI